MQLLIDPNPLITGLLDSLHTTSVQVRDSLVLKQAGVIIERGRDPFRLIWEERVVGVLAEGTVPMRLSDSSLVVLEAGDLIGLGRRHTEFELPTGVGEFAVILDLYLMPPEPLPDLVVRYILEQANFYLQLAHYVGAKAGIGIGEDPPRVQQYEEGDLIIGQGESNNDVFTLVEGTAEALVDGIRVGTIGSDEIFGAIAALAGVPRTATIRATSRCIALRMAKDEFTRLMQSRPATVMRMLQDMARALTNMNEQFVNQVRQIG
jgi:hypothetical protein